MKYKHIKITYSKPLGIFSILNSSEISVNGSALMACLLILNSAGITFETGALSARVICFDIIFWVNGLTTCLNLSISFLRCLISLSFLLSSLSRRMMNSSFVLSSSVLSCSNRFSDRTVSDSEGISSVEL